jgi:hypothetical protein
MTVPSDDDTKSRWREVLPCEKCGGANKQVVRSERLTDTKKLKILECGHEIPMETIVVNESFNITEILASVLEKNPVAEIEKAFRNNDYSTALALACTVFEHRGKEILAWYVKKNPKKTVIITVWNKNKNKNYNVTLSPEKARKLKLHAVIDALALSEIITDDDATKMHCIRQLRNNFLHGDSALKLTSAMTEKVYARKQDIINYTTILKDKYDELAAKAEAGAAVMD